MRCGEDQARDKLKIDPLIARAFLNQTLEHMKPYLDASGIKQDGLMVPEALEKVANDSGLSVQTVAKIIQSDNKLFSISKQAFARQREAGAVKVAARTIAENGAPRNGTITRAYNDLRRLVLTGHSPVFPFTHARNLLYGPQAERQIFYGMVHDAWSFRGQGKGDFNHAAAIADMKSSPTYALQRAAGLDVEPGTLHKGDILIRPESGTVLSKGAQKLGEWVADSKLGKAMRLDPANATKTFDALKIGRSKLFDYYWDKTDPALKTEAYARLLARDLNYATGSVGTPIKEAAMPIDRLVKAASDTTGNILLSSKLFYAKRMEAANILRYGPTRAREITGNVPGTVANIFNREGTLKENLSDLISKGGKMTPEERAIANLGLQRWARITATQLGILGANVAFAKAMGLKLPNLTDASKADWGRMKIGNFVVPLSPLMEAVREPVRAVAAAVTKRSVYEGAKEAVRPVVNALTPGIQVSAEQVTGKEPFSGRPVPSVRNVIQPPKTSKQPAMGMGEYAATRLSPIAVGGGIHEFYQALRDEGVSPSISTAFIKAAAGAATSGLAATHVYEEHEKPAKQKPVY